MRSCNTQVELLSIQENPNLKAYNTFGISVFAKALVTIAEPEELVDLVQNYQHLRPFLFLGGGSNLLFTKDFAGTVVLVRPKGKKLLSQAGTTALVAAGAGENWHEFVQWTLGQNWYGLENLSLIPGNVGTAPMQNIGAYGVEMKDSFHSLTAYNLETLQPEEFDAADCQFGYRESFFKREGKGRYVIWNVRFSLSTVPATKVAYGAIQEELAALRINRPTPQDVAQAVINIRQSKLPDPAVLGNSGSFFKNPVIPTEQAERLVAEYPQLVRYPAGQGTKLAAGWLIEQAGWKGYRRGDAGVHAKQALVLVNHGQATGPELWQLAQDIMQSVQEKFGVQLEPEVNIL